MAEFQPQVAGVVVAFPQHLPRFGGSSQLSPRDRIELAAWRDPAWQAGYDRMVVHDCDSSDNIGVGDFLCLYRRGDAWSRWGFARTGFGIYAWCCLTGADRGEFETLDDALSAVVHGVASLGTLRAAHRRGVTDLRPRLRSCRSLEGAIAG